MAFSSGKKSGPMAEINVTPLVDVMLVLLIIFMITAPKPTNKVIVDLPQKTKQALELSEPPEPVKLIIKANGDLYWNDSLLLMDALDAQIKVELAKAPEKQPQIQIDADETTQYQTLADVLAVTRRVGYKKLGFLNMGG